jgi:hypothetical protein
MRFSRSWVLAACLIVPALGFAQKEDWLPVTPQDLQVKEVPGNPGASAIQLYFADYIDDDEQTEFFYYRIKILNDKGKQYADVQIEIPPDGSVDNIKARTIHPDGRIVDFNGKPFQKTLIKGRGIKFLADTFTLPDVTPGSIIEYKYKITWPGILTDNYWPVQHYLYTVKESLRMKTYAGRIEGFDNGYQVSLIAVHMSPDLKPRRKGNTFEMEAQNMPALDDEGYMPPEDDYRPEVHFFYLDPLMSNPDKFWQEAGKQWYEDAEHFIGSRKEIADAAALAIGPETDPEKKLRALYARAQKIRNFSYEHDRSQAEQKKEKIKDNQNAGDVLTRDYGSRNEITRLFVALARAAGFEASILRVSDRKVHVFNRGVLSRRQLEAEIAVVKLKGQDVYLDPGTRFCPYGLQPWPHTSTPALKLDKKGGNFLMTPSAGYTSAVIRRNVVASLDAAGSLQGEITVEFTDQEALQRRLDAIDTDEAGRKHDMEGEVRDWLPSGANLKLTGIEGWESADAPLVAHFTLDFPNYASAAGKRLLVPAYLFQAKQGDAFKHAERKYPVYFPYAFSEFDDVTLNLPSGYTPESVPPSQDASLETIPQKQEAPAKIALYQSMGQLDGTRLVTQRALLFNGVYIPLELYPNSRTFFNKVQAGDEQQAVLQSGGVHVQTTSH